MTPPLPAFPSSSLHDFVPNPLSRTRTPPKGTVVERHSGVGVEASFVLVEGFLLFRDEELAGLCHVQIVKEAGLQFSATALQSREQWQAAGGFLTL